ncbi:hypothetical protein BVC80_8967g37 [Macleaya cordata]|uniref:DNA-binding protein BIN4 n=1 Tax=Macleaya cordata TaxID=56857 RepID=A0A200PM07_MACCD|nr:hypothetical protein BVC80_8967g37 [Macleaya cordata]
MSNSREGSPDWLRSFQAPKRSFLTLSSDSDPSQNNSPSREDDIYHEEPAVHKAPKLQKGDKNQDAVLIDSEDENPISNLFKKKESPISKAPKSKSPKPRAKVETETLKEVEKNQDGVLIGSGEESHVRKPPKSKSPKAQVKVESQSRKEVEKNQDAVLIDSGDESQVKKAPKSKAPKARLKVESQSLKEVDDGKGETMKEEIPEKRAEPRVSSRLPLLMSEKVHRSKVLVECEGDSIDMSGDVGSVGRLVIADTPCGNSELLLDLKGTIYKTTIVPSRTFCIVNFGQAEAKIEAVMNDFIQLKPHSNVYEAETMIEGTLEGFSFESDEEADKIPKAKPQGEEGEEQEANGKIKGKADKSLGVRKKGKQAAKPPTKGRRKAPAPKKAKSAKK